MIEEYARHNGHADLLRERIDGATGDVTDGSPRHPCGPLCAAYDGERAPRTAELRGCTEREPRRSVLVGMAACARPAVVRPGAWPWQPRPAPARPLPPPGSGRPAQVVEPQIVQGPAREVLEPPAAGTDHAARRAAADAPRTRVSGRAPAMPATGREPPSAGRTTRPRARTARGARARRLPVVGPPDVCALGEELRPLASRTAPRPGSAGQVYPGIPEPVHSAPQPPAPAGRSRPGRRSRIRRPPGRPSPRAPGRGGPARPRGAGASHSRRRG